MTSRLPKPEISPKPAHLVAQLAKPKITSPKNGSLPQQQQLQNHQQASPKSSTSSESSTPGTASMLKSTLKRITKLTSSPVSRSQSFR